MKLNWKKIAWDIWDIADLIGSVAWVMFGLAKLCLKSWLKRRKSS